MISGCYVRCKLFAFLFFSFLPFGIPIANTELLLKQHNHLTLVALFFFPSIIPVTRAFRYRIIFVFLIECKNNFFFFLSFFFFYFALRLRLCLFLFLLQEDETKLNDDARTVKVKFFHFIFHSFFPLIGITLFLYSNFLLSFSFLFNFNFYFFSLATLSTFPLKSKLHALEILPSRLNLTLNKTIQYYTANK